MNHVWAMPNRSRNPSTYQTAPPGRPLVPSVRRSPGRLSRGFMPGGVLRLAKVDPCHYVTVQRPTSMVQLPGAGSRARCAMPSHVGNWQSSSGRDGFLLERQAAFSNVYDNPIALSEVALQDAQRQRIEHPALDGPLQRPGSVHRIVALRHDESSGPLAQLDVNLPVL